MTGDQVDWARYLLGACSSGDPLRQAVVRNFEQVEQLKAELEAYRSSVTTGGPPAPITEGWTPGDSSRPPTAPPGELVVSMLLTDEEAAQVAGRKRLLHWRAYGGQGEPPPPEELVVALPVTDEEFGELRYRTCEDCGQPHPAWISCEAERDVLAVDHVDEPPPR